MNEEVRGIGARGFGAGGLDQSALLKGLSDSGRFGLAEEVTFPEVGGHSGHPHQLTLLFLRLRTLRWTRSNDTLRRAYRHA
jgi:hypothetical protein